MIRALGSIFGFSTLAKSSLMSCAEGSLAGKLVRLLGVSIMGELAPGLFVFDILALIVNGEEDEMVMMIGQELS